MALWLIDSWEVLEERLWSNNCGDGRSWRLVATEELTGGSRPNRGEQVKSLGVFEPDISSNWFDRVRKRS